jgi:hypothetical protein
LDAQRRRKRWGRSPSNSRLPPLESHQGAPLPLPKKNGEEEEGEGRLRRKPALVPSFANVDGCISGYIILLVLICAFAIDVVFKPA